MSIRALTQNLRHAPASILLLSSQASRDQKLMEDAAAQSRSQWLFPQLHWLESAADNAVSLHPDDRPLDRARVGSAFCHSTH